MSLCVSLSLSLTPCLYFPHMHKQPQSIGTNKTTNFTICDRSDTPMRAEFCILRLKQGKSKRTHQQRNSTTKNKKNHNSRTRRRRRRRKLRKASLGQSIRNRTRKPLELIPNWFGFRESRPTDRQQLNQHGDSHRFGWRTSATRRLAHPVRTVRLVVFAE